MKTISKICTLIIVINLSTWALPQKALAQTSVSFQVFYDNLSPYGTWIDNPNYGYVWVPNVGAGFAPYSTNGYWVYTDAGWTWVSNYPWGWAPFHYGRWYTDPVYGAAWVPDTEWGPGWVSWRTSEDYYGWAPIEPGISISVAYSNAYNVPNNHWRFVRSRDFGNTNINNYYINRQNNVTIIKNTTVINNPRVDNTRNVTYNVGPNKEEVQKHIGKPITQVAITENNKPGQQFQKDKGQLNIYRPQVQKNAAGEPKPAPSKVGTANDIKKPAQNAAMPSQKSGQLMKQNKTQTQQNTNQPVKQGTAPNPNQSPKQKVWSSQNNNPNNQSGQPQNTNQPMKQKSAQQPMKQNKMSQPQNLNTPIKQASPTQNVQQPIKQKSMQPQNMPQPMKQASPPQNVQQPMSRPVSPQPNMNRPMQQSPPQQRQFPQQERQPGKK